MNILSKRPLLTLSAAFAAGMLLSAIAVLNTLSHLTISVFLLIPPMLLFLLFFLQKRTWIYPLLLSAVFLFGFFYGNAYDGAQFRTFRQCKEGSTLEFSGAVLSSEETDPGIVRCLLYGSVSKKSDKDIWIYCDFYGESHPKNGELIDAIISPYASETPAYYYKNGVAGYATCRSLFQVTGLVEETLSFRLRSVLAEWQQRSSERVTEAGGALYSALLLNDEDALSSADRLAFRRIGATHLLSVSGLHLVIVCSFFLLLLSLFPTPKLLRLLLLSLVILSYGALTGFPRPLLRASVMVLIVELARVVRRLPDSLTSLGVALALLLLCSPSSVYDIGLWLSFAATFGIIVTASLFPEMMARKKKNTSRLLLYLKASLLTTLGATLFTSLLTLFFFGEFSLISPLSNLLLAPITTLILFLGIFLLPLGKLPILAPLCQTIGNATLELVHWLASPSDLLIPLGSPLVQLAILLSVTLLIGTVLLPIKPRKQDGEEKNDFLKRKRRLLRSLYLGASGGVVLSLLLSLLLTANTKSFLYKKSDFNDTLICKNGFSVDMIQIGGTSYDAYETLTFLRENHIKEIDRLYIMATAEDTQLLALTLADGIFIRELCLLPPHVSEESEAYAFLLDEVKKSRLSLSHYQAPAEDGAFSLLSYHTRAAGAYHRTELSFRLHLSDGTEILYATAEYLTNTEQSQRDFLTKEADVLILGAYPALYSEGPLLYPGEQTTVIEAYPSVFRYHPDSRPKALLSPSVFSLEFQ